VRIDANRHQWKSNSETNTEESTMLKKTAYVLILLAFCASPVAFAQSNEDLDESAIEAEAQSDEESVEDEDTAEESDGDDQADESADNAEASEQEQVPDDEAAVEEEEATDETNSDDGPFNDLDVDDPTDESASTQASADAPTPDPVSETGPASTASNPPPAAPSCVCEGFLLPTKEKPSGVGGVLTAPYASGAVKWFSNSKCIGMITPSDGGHDIFVGNGFGCLAENAPVAYRIRQTDKGPRAVDVTRR
jgi:cold shock CspA family protein